MPRVRFARNPSPWRRSLDLRARTSVRRVGRRSSHRCLEGTPRRPRRTGSRRCASSSTRSGRVRRPDLGIATPSTSVQRERWRAPRTSPAGSSSASASNRSRRAQARWSSPPTRRRRTRGSATNLVRLLGLLVAVDDRVDRLYHPHRGIGLDDVASHVNTHGSLADGPVRHRERVHLGQLLAAGDDVGTGHDEVTVSNPLST